MLATRERFGRRPVIVATGGESIGGKHGRGGLAPSEPLQHGGIELVLRVRLHRRGLVVLWRRCWRWRLLLLLLLL